MLNPCIPADFWMMNISTKSTRTTPANFLSIFSNFHYPTCSALVFNHHSIHLVIYRVSRWWCLQNLEPTNDESQNHRLPPNLRRPHSYIITIFPLHIIPRDYTQNIWRNSWTVLNCRPSDFLHRIRYLSLFLSPSIYQCVCCEVISTKSM